MFLMRSGVFGLLVLAVGAGCRESPRANLAPVDSTTSSVIQASPGSIKLDLDPATSQVSFVMNAPLENIYGQIPEARGELQVDPADLRKSRGVVRVDLNRLELQQESRKDDKAAFEPRVKSDIQNKHARSWLEISEDAPPEELAKNRRVEFRIEAVTQASESDLSKLTGAKREVTVDVSGEMLLHQRKSPRTARLKLVFEYAGDQLKGVTATTLVPFTVSLEAHDVRPRDAFGKLAERTLESVGQKVNKEPAVSFAFRAALGS